MSAVFAQVETVSDDVLADVSVSGEAGRDDRVSRRSA